MELSARHQRRAVTSGFVSSKHVPDQWLGGTDLLAVIHARVAFTRKRTTTHSAHRGLSREGARGVTRKLSRDPMNGHGIAATLRAFQGTTTTVFAEQVYSSRAKMRLPLPGSSREGWRP